MTKEDKNCFCEGLSDRDFIYNVFSINGFVNNANGFLKKVVNKKSVDESVTEQISHFDGDECKMEL